MMSVRSVVALYVELAVALDVQFRGISTINLFYFEAALEDGVLGLKHIVLVLERIVLVLEGLVLGLEGFQVLGVFDLEGFVLGL